MKSYNWEPYTLPPEVEGAKDLTFELLPPDAQQMLRLRAASGNASGIIPKDSVFEPYSVEVAVGAMSELDVFAVCGLRPQIIGAMSVDPRMDEDFLWLDSLAVDPRERSRGIGAEAIRVAEMVARNYNLSVIAGNAQPNERTLLFYQKNGFDIFGTSGDYLRIMKDVA